MIKLLNNLFKKYLIFILTISVLIILVIITFFILIPKAKSIIDKRQTMEDKKILLEKLIAKRRLLDSMTGGENVKYFEEAQKALPNEKDAAGVLISLENLVQKTQFGISSVSLSPGMISSKSADKTKAPVNVAVEKNKGANFLPIKISASGQTANFLSFLTQLPKIRPLFDISQISVSYQTGKDALTANISLNAYYLIPITEIGSLESSLPELTPQEKQALISLANLPYLGVLPEENIINVPTGKSNLFAP